MSKSITFNVTNWTPSALSFKSNTPNSSAFKANLQTVAPGGTIVVKSNSSATQATFSLTGMGGAFTWGYSVQRGDVAITKSCGGGSVAFSEKEIYSGSSSVTVNANVYKGVAVQSDSASNPGYAVPLAANPYAQRNNIQDFVNSMFGDNMRSRVLISNVQGETGQTVAQPADYTGGQLNAIIKLLTNGWMNNANIGPDGPIIQFLANYLIPKSGTPLTMWVPQIQMQPGSGAPIYYLSGYKGLVFWNNGWNQEGIWAFLQLFLCGAHFVSISASEDLTSQGLSAGAGRSLYGAFLGSQLPSRADPANSHYTENRLGNTNGYYYTSISEEYAPAGCGFICALLFAPTVDGAYLSSDSYNTFMQLEGWQMNFSDLSKEISKGHIPKGGGRHGKDFQVHEQTLWNISTFGASPYSEKRATTVFLAPGGWTPDMYQITRMAPYVGAYATGTPPAGQPQPWLKTNLVTVPNTLYPLPSKYYT